MNGPSPGQSEAESSASPRERAEPVAEADGKTTGEAKWAALRELDRELPGIGADDVAFEVLSEEDEAAGRSARVRATADVGAWEARVRSAPAEPAERVRELVRRVVAALELRASVDIEETEDEIRATVNGEDLGLLIGRHGSTIDAVQHLAARSAFRGAVDRKRVVVDAAGYRERRDAQLQRAADRAVEDALSFGRPVELEPMAAHERKTVHEYLKGRADVDTYSEGDEPERRLVVSPVAPGR